MANQVTKIIIRSGTDLQRRTANSTGISFNLSEPAFCTDTQRLYIGNNNAGGVPVSVRNLGRVNQLFGSYLDSGFTQEAYNTLANQGAEAGDFIFDETTRTIYSLSARSNFGSSYVPLVGDFVKYDVSTLINTSQFFYDGALQLNLADQGVSVTNINSNAVDGITIVKPTSLSPISVAPGTVSNGVANTNLRFIAANSLFLNSTNAAACPNIVTCYPNQVVGRTTSSTLTAVGIQQLLYSASFTAGTGLTITPTIASILFDFDPVYLKIGATMRINKPSVIAGTLSAVGITTVDNATNSTAYTNGALVVKGGAGFNGSVYLNGAINATGAATIGGTLDVTGNINSNGDITAFYSSDQRLKSNVKKIENALEKVEKISGVSFDWNEKSGKTGSDYGVLAQEIEKVLPELVVTRDTGYKAVRYEKLVSLLIEAVKELNKKLSK
jgi:hypothetical protein